MKKLFAATLCGTLFLFPALCRAESDAAGCKDSPLLTRYPGAALTDCTDKPDDAWNFQVADKVNWVEGEYHQARYDFSKLASKAEVVRNLKTALAAPGFTVLAQGDNGYFIARAGKSWISVDVSGGNYVQTVVVEIKLLQLMTGHPDGKYTKNLNSTAKPDPDAKGCTDSPLITRFPGSVLTDCSDKADDRYNFTDKEGKAGNFTEGEFHSARYDFSKVASKAEVVRNIRIALQAGGFTMVHDGDNGSFTAQAGKNWISEDVGGGNYVQTIVVEKKLEQLVSANAAALYSGLKTNGHMPIYGVYFDTGKADITPASADALKEVAKLVQKDPALRLYVVGHTDNVGSVGSNIDLSQRRAAAVQKVLTTTEYGVPAAVLVGSFGAGPYAPVASNADEDGRAHNRRVELVAQ